MDKRKDFIREKGETNLRFIERGLNEISYIVTEIYETSNKGLSVDHAVELICINKIANECLNAYLQHVFDTRIELHERYKLKYESDKNGQKKLNCSDVD